MKKTKCHRKWNRMFTSYFTDLKNLAFWWIYESGLGCIDQTLAHSSSDFRLPKKSSLSFLFEYLATHVIFDCPFILTTGFVPLTSASIPLSTQKSTKSILLLA